MVRSVPEQPRDVAGVPGRDHDRGGMVWSPPTGSKTSLRWSSATILLADPFPSSSFSSSNKPTYTIPRSATLGNGLPGESGGDCVSLVEMTRYIRTKVIPSLMESSRFLGPCMSSKEKKSPRELDA